MRIRRRGPSLVVDAPAKLNLYLNVLGRRSDGYHELETVMVSVGLYDTLRFTPVEESEQDRLSIYSGLPSCPPLPATADNLVLRAARLLRSHTGYQGHLAVELCKRIPWGAGLGGGSSDAAATLVALNRLWNTGLNSFDLHTLAAQLGSDVNFFLDSDAAAICRGRGEQISPRQLGGPQHFVIAQPFEGLATSDVFGALQIEPTSVSPTRLMGLLSGGSATCPPDVLYNSLEKTACGLHPGVQHVLNQLRTAGVRAVAMSGSGSACFGIVSSRRQARHAASQLESVGECRVFVASTAV